MGEHADADVAGGRDPVAGVDVERLSLDRGRDQGVDLGDSALAQVQVLGDRFVAVLDVDLVGRLVSVAEDPEQPEHAHALGAILVLLRPHDVPFLGGQDRGAQRELPVLGVLLVSRVEGVADEAAEPLDAIVLADEREEVVGLGVPARVLDLSFVGEGVREEPAERARREADRRDEDHHHHRPGRRPESLGAAEGAPRHEEQHEGHHGSEDSRDDDLERLRVEVLGPPPAGERPAEPDPDRRRGPEP
jgi:hypothetical protein